MDIRKTNRRNHFPFLAQLQPPLIQILVISAITPPIIKIGNIYKNPMTKVPAKLSPPGMPETLHNKNDMMMVVRTAESNSFTQFPL
jgi:hypothetical protein